jgi:hypothetical protein
VEIIAEQQETTRLKAHQNSLKFTSFTVRSQSDESAGCLQHKAKIAILSNFVAQ